MKSQKVKRILLAVLLVIAGYIWWGNLQLFKRNRAPSPQKSTAGLAPRRSGPTKAGLVYRPPKTNPFLKSLTSSSLPSIALRQLSQPRPLPKLHEHYHLSGLLNRGKVSQAILDSEESGSNVLSLRDSIENWQLIRVEEQYAVFKQGKRYDTLWLAPKPK